MKIYEIDSLRQNVAIARQKLNDARDKDMSMAVIKVRTQALNEAKKELEEYEANYKRLIGVDYESMGYAFFKSGGIGDSAINEEFMLGFVFALAEYTANFRTIKEAFLAYFNEANTKQFLKLAKEFKENQTEWVRWPNLPFE